MDSVFVPLSGIYGKIFMWGTFWRMAIYPNSDISQPAESVIVCGDFFSHCSTAKATIEWHHDYGGR